MVAGRYRGTPGGARNSSIPPNRKASHLTDDDLADPSIAANLRATADTAALITWVAEDTDEATAFGCWRGPADLPLADAPIVSLDNEGLFSLLRGTSLSEALCDEYGQWEDDAYATMAAACGARGVAISADDPEDLPEPDVSPTPDEHHRARYDEEAQR